MGEGDFHPWYMIDEIDLAGMVADHAGLGRLCDDLETMADRLPAPPGDGIVQHLREELVNRVPTHDARESALLARLFDDQATQPGTEPILEQIRCRRASCVVQAQDLVAAFKGDGIAPGPETLGYMLRSFFQTCRQCMAFEELAILHLGADRLTASASALLVQSLRRCSG